MKRMIQIDKRTFQNVQIEAGRIACPKFYW